MQSFSPKLCARVAFAACVYLSAGCGSAPSNLYDAPSSGPAAASGGSGGPSSSGGASPAAGTNGMNAAGSTSAGGTSMGAGGIPGDQSHASCSPAKDVTGGASGAFGTTGPACFRVAGDIAGWGCSNFDGRTVKVNGRTVMCAELPLPDKIDGAYYFDISAGMFDYASFYWF